MAAGRIERLIYSNVIFVFGLALIFCSGILARRDHRHRRGAGEKIRVSTRLYLMYGFLFLTVGILGLLGIIE